jgi:hypothetical protein
VVLLTLDRSAARESVGLPRPGGELAGAGAGVGVCLVGEAAEVAGGADGAVLLEVAVDDVGADQRLHGAVARPVLHGLGAVGALAAGVVDGLLQRRVRLAGLAHAPRAICRRNNDRRLARINKGDATDTLFRR